MRGWAPESCRQQGRGSQGISAHAKTKKWKQRVATHSFGVFCSFP